MQPHKKQHFYGVMTRIYHNLWIITEEIVVYRGVYEEKL